MMKTARCFAALAVLLVFAAPASYAVPVTFTVDPAQSELSIVVSSLFGTASEQAPGSWTTSYSGSIVADVTSSTIQILPTSTLVAGNSGVWGPGIIYPTTDPPTDRAEDDIDYVNSSAEANYGTVTDLTPIGGPAASNSATRDIQLSLSDAAPKSLTGGAFSEEGIQPGFLSGIVWLSYGNASAVGPVSDLTLPEPYITVSPTVDTASEGTLSQSGNLLTLTLPLEFTESHFGSNTTYSGTIVATAVVPEPMTVALLLPVASLLWTAHRRRLKVGSTL